MWPPDWTQLRPPAAKTEVFLRVASGQVLHKDLLNHFIQHIDQYFVFKSCAKGVFFSKCPYYVCEQHKAITSTPIILLANICLFALRMKTFYFELNSDEN